MTAIPILSGITASEQAEFALSLPVNLEPLSVESGLSKGMFRAAAGITPLFTTSAADRGGIVWNGTHYRVLGSQLSRVDTSVTAVGAATLGGSEPVRLDYGPNQLGICAGGKLWLFDGTNTTQITDPDLGTSLDFIWIAGYFMSTDGTNIVTNLLSDPFSVDPLKYASAESDPDPIVGLLKHRDQAVVFGSNTIQFFSNVGGTGFPFAAQTGATIPIGLDGRSAKCLYSQGFAWVGAGRNHASAVWFSDGSTPVKLSTRAIDDMLAAEPNRAAIEVESVTARDEQRLYVHLSDRTLIYLKTASEAAQDRLWYIGRSGILMDAAYRARHPVLYNGQWIVGDALGNNLGTLDDTIMAQFGNPVGWQFDTKMIYNEAKGGILHELELVGLPGRGTGSTEVRLQFTFDGETHTQPKASPVLSGGQRGTRVKWRPNRSFRNYMGLRFRGDSTLLPGWTGIEAEIEPLSV